MPSQSSVALSSIAFLLSDPVSGLNNNLNPRSKMVHLHGQTRVTTLVARRAARAAGMHSVSEVPPDPKTLLSASALEEKAEQLYDWFRGKQSVLCITGAGLSTDSGIPDYRGNNGSYHRGHKPIIHQQYMESDATRRRYWGRSMVGWSEFDSAQPNPGHFALADLERMGRIGVHVDDRPEFYEPNDADEYYFSPGHQKLAIVTQNVDSLHQRAGSEKVLQIHGKGSLIQCMNCGIRRDRNEFHRELETANQEWVTEARQGYERSSEMRPDGDAAVKKEVDYNQVHVPNCPHCKTGFYKPDVVFFGDTVPKQRVEMVKAAVDSSDGILVVGTSLAVHSAYRHVRAASQKGIPIAILNVGETRAEAEGLDGILKFEAPAGDTLSACVGLLDSSQ